MQFTGRIERISIVGAGAVGGSLANALFEAGLQIDFVVDRFAPKGQSVAEQTGSEYLSTLNDRLAVSEVVLVAVPDQEVGAVSNEGAALRGNLSHQVWLHTAGALSASALRSIAPHVLGTGGFHPACAFPKDRITSLPANTAFGVDGNDAALQVCTDLARAMGGRTVLIPGTARALYHASCVLASNAVIGLLTEAARALAEGGVDKDDAARLLIALTQGAVSRAAALGLEAALTGPIRRGDVDTVSEHLKALAGDAAADALYRATSIAVLNATRAADFADADALSKIERLLYGKGY